MLTPALPEAGDGGLAEPLTAALRAWLDDGDRSALDAACEWLRRHPVDVGRLLAWVAQAGADARATDLALRRLRLALGLPVIAGPACRRGAAR